MPTRSITVTVSNVGLATGPFDISDDVLGPIASGVTRAQLLAGYNVNSDVNATKIVIQSTGGCNNSLTLYLSTPTPTPTPTIGPTATPTPTPTINNIVLFDSNYTGYSNICGEGGKVWTRLIGAPGTSIDITLQGQHYITSISGTSACFYGTMNETTLPSLSPTAGALLGFVSKTVNSAEIPTYATNSTIITVVIPPAGYKDIILTYKTTNLTAGFTNGSLTATITAINGVSYNTSLFGTFIMTNYQCSDIGACSGTGEGYYPYAVSSVGYPTCGEACDSLVDTNLTLYAKVPNGADLVGQYLYSDTNGTLWDGGTGGYHRIIRTGRLGFSAQIEPTGYVYTVNTCTASGVCG